MDLNTRTSYTACIWITAWQLPCSVGS